MAHGVNHATPGPGRRCLSLVACLVTAGLLLAAAGCAPHRVRPPERFYEAAPSSMRGVDVSCLEGKRIVIDPGHGGVFRGAIGRGGLAEADVNLGVALYLWGLLRDAGAEALLTRSSDMDFVGGAASELRLDLARRTEIAASFRPDFFVSLHHNADISGAKDKNQVETYFKMLDDGPSKDVAVLVHTQLRDRLEIPQGEVVPGNYFVLRNAPCTAVLGEPSYITNPWVEDRLRLAEKQLLEAQAYFLGIVEYFSRGVPSIVALAPRDTVLREAWPSLTAELAEERTAVDPVTVNCELDGARIDASLAPSGRELTARPEKPLAGGTHEFCFSLRNVAGNSSGRVCASFDTDPVPVTMSLRAEPAGLTREGCVLVTAVVSDENANPVRDGTPVVFSTSAGGFGRDTVLTVNGVASSLFFGGEGADRVSLRAASRGLVDSVSLAPSGATASCLSVADWRTGEPIGGAEVVGGDSVRTVTTPQGLAVVAGGADGVIVSSIGYVPVLITAESEQEAGNRFHSTVRLPKGTRTVWMKPVALGVLQGVKIAVDAGAVSVKRGDRESRSLGYRAVAPGLLSSALTEAVAKELASLLTGAGARVLLLGPDTPDDEKVEAAERFGAQKYLRIEPAPDGRAVILHYPESKAGQKLATRLAAWSGKIVKATQPRVSEDSHYVLRQTSAPAVVARIAAVREQLERAAALRAAYSFYLGLLEDAGLDASLLIESSVRASGSFAGEAADMVLDGFIRVPLSEDGSGRFFCEEGVHMVTVVSGSRQTAPHFVTVRPAQKVGDVSR